MIQWTPRQREIAQIFARYQVQHGYAPTLEEVAGELGINKTTVWEHARAMLAKGILVRVGKARSARSLQLADEATPRCPKCGAALDRLAEVMR